MKYLLAALFLLASTSHALSLKQQVPPIVILYPDGSYYTLKVDQEIFVTDYPAYQLQEDDLEIRFIQIEPWDKRDFEVDIDIVPAPKLITGEDDG